MPASSSPTQQHKLTIVDSAPIPAPPCPSSWQECTSHSGNALTSLAAGCPSLGSMHQPPHRHGWCTWHMWCTAPRWLRGCLQLQFSPTTRQTQRQCGMAHLVGRRVALRFQFSPTTLQTQRQGGMAHLVGRGVALHWDEGAHAADGVHAAPVARLDHQLRRSSRAGGRRGVK